MRTSITNNNNNPSSNRNSTIKDKSTLPNPVYVELENLSNKAKIVVNESETEEEIFEGK